MCELDRTDRMLTTFLCPRDLTGASQGCIMIPKRLMESPKAESGTLLPGTLDMLILKTLKRGWQHGYGIAEYLHQTSEDVLKVEEGALYPALHRLELRGLLASEWGYSENNRRAKYYGLTSQGRKFLSQETDQWNRMSAVIGRILNMA